MSQILVKFDNKLKQSEIQIPLTRSSVEESGDNYELNVSDKQQTSTYGIISPLIKINNIVIDFTDVEYFELNLTGTLPRLQCTVHDRYNFIKILDTPGADNEIRVQIIPQFDNAYKKIDLTFQIGKIELGDVISLSGTYKLPEFISSQYKCFGKLDTYSLFEKIAIDTKLGFATNCDKMQDERYIYCANESYNDLLQSEIEISESDETHVYNWWIDPWNNLNLVNIFDRYNTIESDEDMMIWVSGENGQISKGIKITPQRVPAVLNNNPYGGNTELCVKHYDINNSPGIYTSTGTDKVVSTYFEKTGDYNDNLIMDGDVKEDIYKHYEYGGEVFGDYNYILAKQCREAFLQKVGTDSITAYLNTPMICLARGMKVNFIWYTNDFSMNVKQEILKEMGGMNDTQTTPILDDSLDTTSPDYVPRPMKEFVKDDSVSGQYMINGVIIRYEDYEWQCELTLNRPQSQKSQILKNIEE